MVRREVGTAPSDNAQCSSGFSRWAALFDLVNLGGLVANLAGTTSSRRVRDVSERVEETLALFA